MSEQVTVEQCLKELRETFPGKAVSIRHDESFYPADCRDGAETMRTVAVKVGYLESEPKFRDRTLAGVMAQVRAWRKAQELNTVLPQPQTNSDNTGSQ